MVKEFQIAELLRVANELLTCCEIIVNYPIKMGKNGFDPVSPVDVFYKSACNAFFSESVLMINSLLDKNKDTISFWNFKDFVLRKRKELESLNNKLTVGPFKNPIRNKMVGHVEIDFWMVENRIKGIIKMEIVKLLRELFDETIKELRDYSLNFSAKYADDYFEADDAKKRTMLVLSQAKPILTDNDLI